MNKDVLSIIDKFNKDRDWDQFHTNENLAKALAIEATELLELYQWSKDFDDKEKLSDELADVLAYAYMIAMKNDLDIDEIVVNKIKKNEEKYPVSKSFGSSKKYTDL